ncbi:MAG: MFS transporter [Lawsonibacter sp.]|jgi:MFS family permease
MKRLHYAWFVCLGGAMALFCTIGLGINLFSVFQPELIRLNGFSNAQGSWITTTRSLFTLASLFTVNQLCARFGLRLVMTLGTVLVGLSCLCFGAANSFPFYCLAAALTGIGYCYGGMVPLSLAIGHWFRDRQGLALGLAAAGSGISTILAPGLLTGLMNRFGLAAAFWVEGAFILAVSVLVWLLVRDNPRAMAMYPYSLGGMEQPRPIFRPQAPAPTSAQRLGLLLATLLVGGMGGPGFSHLMVLYTSEGYSSAMVAFLMSYLGAVISLGKILCGYVYDRLGGRLGNWYIFGVSLLGLLLCSLAPLGGMVLPLLAVTLFGLGLPISAVSPARWASDLFPSTGYEPAVRSLTVAYTVGMLVFGPVPGALADWLGSYVPAYLLFALLLVAAALILQGIYRAQRVGGPPASLNAPSPTAPPQPPMPR